MLNQELDNFKYWLQKTNTDLDKLQQVKDEVTIDVAHLSLLYEQIKNRGI